MFSPGEPEPMLGRLLDILKEDGKCTYFLVIRRPLSKGDTATMLGTSEKTSNHLLSCHNGAQVVSVQSSSGQVPEVEPGKGGLSFPGSSPQN